MKVIIAGTRTFNDYEKLKREVSQFNFDITEVVSGCSRGADTLGERYADENNIPVKPFEAEWKKYGKPAGPIRNGLMAEYGDILIAFWDGDSDGTADMIKQMKAKKKPVHIILYKENTL